MVSEDKDQIDVLKPDPYYSERHATFGDRLFAARDSAGLSQKLLASKLGVKSKTVQAWESDSIEPRANKLQMVSALLNVSMVWLMSGLGSGIAPPGEMLQNSSSEVDGILKELQEIRLAGESLLNLIQSLEIKIGNNLSVINLKNEK